MSLFFICRLRTLFFVFYHSKQGNNVTVLLRLVLFAHFQTSLLNCNRASQTWTFCLINHSFYLLHLLAV